MLIKQYAYIAAFLIAVGAFWGVYRMGGAACREASANAAREHLERQNSLLVELEESKKTREVIVRDKIRVIEKSTADCLSVRLDDVDRLQLNGGAKAK